VIAFNADNDPNATALAFAGLVKTPATWARRVRSQAILA
jgi:hypothetical protein